MLSAEILVGFKMYGQKLEEGVFHSPMSQFISNYLLQSQLLIPKLYCRFTRLVFTSQWPECHHKNEELLNALSKIKQNSFLPGTGKKVTWVSRAF